MKDFINKILDVPKLIIRIWIILWICLIILLVMKFCFGIWYPIVIKNQILLDMSNYIDNSWIKYLILSSFYLLSSNLIYLIACRKYKYNTVYEILFINTIIVVTFIVKCFNNYLGFIGEFIFLILIPIAYLVIEHPETSNIKDIIWTILLEGLIMLWQCNILLVRGLPNPLTSASTLIQVVLQLDYYIFLSVLWIGVSYMGLISVWFFVKDVTKLKSIRDAELAKSHPNMKLVKDIDARIAKLEGNK